jgi:flagellar biogenesis protein FliO
LEQFKDVAGVVIALLVVIFASYYVTKFVSMKAGGTGRRIRCFKILDRFSVSRDKMFVLLSMGKQAYLIGITNQGMTVIDKTDVSELPVEEQVRKPAAVFPDIASFIKSKGFKSKTDTSGSAGGPSFSDFMRDAENAEDHEDE